VPTCVCDISYSACDRSKWKWTIKDAENSSDDDDDVDDENDNSSLGYLIHVINPTVTVLT